ncbi:MAG TPA: hypothetical protein VJS11_15165 [Acidobacteriaceae bacterium]|nr:hypothetical protein [Acidobacteriaceae bacterium]
MPASSSNSVHLVVQHTQTENQSSFRIVAYRPNARFQPAEFSSVEELLKALQRCVAGFDKRWLVLREGEYRGTYIAFMGDFELGESELVQMGLRRI